MIIIFISAFVVLVVTITILSYWNIAFSILKIVIVWLKYWRVGAGTNQWDLNTTADTLLAI